MLLTIICTVLGALWRRWLGAANTGPRSPKIAAGLALFCLTMYPAFSVLTSWQAIAVLLISGGLTLVMWVEGHGQGLDVGTVHGTEMSDLKYMAARYAAIVVPAAGAVMGITGNYVPFLIAVPVGMLIGASWYICFKLKLPHYTAYAEGLAGGLAFGVSAGFWLM